MDVLPVCSTIALVSVCFHQQQCCFCWRPTTRNMSLAEAEQKSQFCLAPNFVVNSKTANLSKGMCCQVRTICVPSMTMNWAAQNQNTHCNILKENAEFCWKKKNSFRGFLLSRPEVISRKTDFVLFQVCVFHLERKHCGCSFIYIQQWLYRDWRRSWTLEFAESQQLDRFVFPAQISSSQHAIKTWCSMKKRNVCISKPLQLFTSFCC